MHHMGETLEWRLTFFAVGVLAGGVRASPAGKGKFKCIKRCI